VHEMRKRHEQIKAKYRGLGVGTTTLEMASTEPNGGMQCVGTKNRGAGGCGWMRRQELPTGVHHFGLGGDDERKCMVE
jgi:hypothetical protein